MRNYSYKELNSIAEKHGESFYLLDIKQFKSNYRELKDAFVHHYPQTSIAYSYKTNYIPALCAAVNDFGGYAEVVSDMEYNIAKQLGVNPAKVVFNGPYKEAQTFEEIICAGGIVNIDSVADFDILKRIVSKSPKRVFEIGIRCNFDVKDNVLSRFGIDVSSKLFEDILCYIKSTKNVKLKGLHCHFAQRWLNCWKNRTTGMFSIIEKYHLDEIKYIDLGGGLFGKMADSLKAQFEGNIPTYQEYAEIVARQFAEYYKDVREEYRPELLIEPGSALVGDVMYFVAKVKNIKQVRGKAIATLLGSIYNINPTLNTKNPSIEIITKDTSKQAYYTDLDFGGYTCVESDYLYKHYTGMLAIGDYVMFGNVGSYSVVLKPPFIMPNFVIVEAGKEHKLIKRKETFEDIFHTYVF